MRKAGEGSDVDPKWKKATAYKKENEEENDEEEEEAVIYLQRSTRQKKLDINFTFADQGGRGGGGDRGRGGRGRGEGRGRGGRGRGDGEGRPPYRYLGSSESCSLTQYLCCQGAPRGRGW